MIMFYFALGHKIDLLNQDFSYNFQLNRKVVYMTINIDFLLNRNSE